ncbi:MAG: molybdopterin-dependent oxidoreductase [Alphaproteobacteria bacterium]|nr:molybdopterin-dependent oxidoreductase [Alphaproteobacteria bacterium]
MTAETGIGARVTRKEDVRFITGRGRYTDDINGHGQLHAVFARSPYAHARIRSLNLAAARQAPGVAAVLTGEDLAAGGVGALPCGWMIHSRDGSPMKQPAHPALAQGTVRYVGEPYAVVIAASREQAQAAAELIDGDFEELPANVDTGSAQSFQPIHADIPNNLCYDWTLGDEAATDAAFAGAAHVVELDIVNNRLIPNAIEPRAALGDYDPGTDVLTLFTTSQNPHLARLVLSAFVGLAPEHKLRVVSPDVGGGFGSKIFIYSEETVCGWASKKLRRPVKWTADRSEAFLNDAHGRDHVTRARLALDADGRFLGLKVSTIANLGAYMSTFSSSIPTYLYGTLLAGQYTTPAIFVEVKAVFTNTTPVDAYRGAGRPEATFLLERIVETAARDLGMDPAALRRKNMVPRDAFPYATPVALVYDTGDYQACLDKALAMADYDGFPARREAARARGRLRGIGLSCYIEACGLAPSRLAGQLGAGVGLYESAEIRVNPTGNVTVFTGTHSHGQGHETTFAQVVSDRFGIPLDQVEVVHGDTAQGQFGLGTYGSRSLAVGGSALMKASDKVIAKGTRIAAYLLETTPDDIDFEGGVFRARGTNKTKTFGEIAFAAYVPHNYPLEELEPGLQETAFYDPQNFTYPAGTYVCEVEVDPETGGTEIVKFTAVDDFGQVINPMIVEGQVHGGIAQGIGQALLEACRYDRESGQLLSGSLMDYAMPRADDLVNFDLDVVRTDCTHNPLGVKGCGEAGAIGSPPAVINAITDAIGVRTLDMPATPLKVWTAMQAGNAAATGS